MIRSPAKASGQSTGAGSQPDLSKISMSSSNTDITLQNMKENLLNPALSRMPKRKHDTDEIGELRTEIREFREEMMGFLESLKTIQAENMKQMTREVASIKEQVNTISSCTDKLSQEQTTIKKSIADLENRQRDDNTNMQQQIQLLNCQIDELTNQFEGQQQRERLCNIEISGLPETKNENIQDLVLKIANHADVPLQASDILNANRVQPRQSSSGRPKTIVCKLKTRLLKDSILAGLRKQRGITTADIGMPGEPKNIYVREHLTVHNKMLLRQAKELATENHFKYTWVRNCRIYVRKSDTSPAIAVTTKNDLSKII